MKKSIVAALAASFILSIAGTALAFPVEFNGDFRLQGRVINDKAGGSQGTDGSWFQLRSRVNFTGAVDEDTTFFGRFSVRNNFGGAQTGTGTNNGAFDQYGIKGKAGEWKYSLGRQAVSLGQGTIVSTGSDAVGVDNKFDGAILSTKSGDFDINVIGGKINNGNGYSGSREVYGFDASTKVDKVTVGAAYAIGRIDGSVGDTKFWGINTSAPVGNSINLSTEYVKSNADTDNSAYFVAGTYSWKKDSFTVQYNNVKKYAVDPFNSGIGSVAYPFMGDGLFDWDNGENRDYKGFTYVYTHSINKSLSFHAIYLDLEATGYTGSDKELGAGLVWSF